jgi:hypothetical protein
MADHKVKPPSANNAGHSSSRFHKKQGEIISEIHEALDNQAASSTLNQEQPKSEVRRRHNPSEEQPPEVEERKPTTGELSGNRVEPHTIIECIQQGSDSVKSWLERTVRGAHANPIRPFLALAPIWAGDPREAPKLVAESGVESPTQHLYEHHVPDDEVAFPGPDPVAVSEVKVEVESDVTVIKIVPPLINLVYQSVRGYQEQNNDVRPLATITPINPVRDTSNEFLEVRNSTHPSISPGEYPPPYPPPIHDPDVKLSGRYGDPFVKRVRFSDPPAKTRALDNNDNIVEYSYIILDETGGQVRRSILPEGHVYDKKIKSPMGNAQEDYDSWYELLVGGVI